tara:strand:+ start:2758 stop:3108 length:351 start_codon:yes stop_codon:yes gene_type:complete
MREVIIDGLIGGIIIGVFSYFVKKYDINPANLKITGYLLGLPILYFYLIHITWKKSKEAMIAFTKHIALGTTLTLFAMIVTLLLMNQSMNKLLIINIGMLIVFISIYFEFEVYNRI